jgi:hypothetical protein
MATYISGVTDFIPEYQPFQPDLNFYGNIMQAKQSIYDQNYKALSGVYNQLYSAELTNKENIKNRDELLKQLDFNLNRIAGLDLSLEQNVEQAKQVFKPFYENKSLMRDMAYTKNWNNTYSSAQALKTSQDEKQRKQYWDEGVRKMQYEREAFANASLDNILKMPDATYTPRVDVPEMYQKLAKDMNLSVDITETNGRYFVRQKNGPLLQAPLTQLFASKLNSDPAIQSYYATKAYVQRMDDAYANKDKYGSVEAAEKEYLKTNYNLLKEQVKIQNHETQQVKNTVQAKLDNVTTDVKEGLINEHTEEYVQSLEEALGLVTVNAEATQKLANELDDKPSSNAISTSVVEGLDLSNIELARMKVDMGMANSYANTDINQQAYLLAHKDMVRDMSADPYGVSSQNHAYRSAEEAQRSANRRNEIMLRGNIQKDLIDHKANLDKEAAIIKAGLENKSLISDGKGGVIPNPAMEQTLTEEGDMSGGAISEYPGGIAAFNKDVDQSYTESYSPMVNKMLSYIKGAMSKDKLSTDQAASMFLGKTEKERSIDKKIEDLNSGNVFSRMGGGLLGWLTKTAREEGLNEADLSKYVDQETRKRIEEGVKWTPENALYNKGRQNIFSTYHQLRKKLDPNYIIPKEHRPGAMKPKPASGYLVEPRSVDWESTEPIFHYNTVEEFKQDFDKNPNKFLTNNGGKFLRSMYDNTVKYAEQNKGAEFHNNFIQSTAPERAGFNEFTLFLDNKQKVLNDNQQALKSAMGSSTVIDNNSFLKTNKDAILNLALTKDGMIISKEAFVNLMNSKFGDKGIEYTEAVPTGMSRAYALAPELFEGRTRTSTGDYGNLYDDLALIHKNTVSDGKVMKSYIPLSSEKAQSFLANKANGFNVFLGAPGTPGFGGFMQFMQNDYSNINWGANENNISFFGTTKTALKNMTSLEDSEGEVYDNQKIRGITNRILQDIWSKVGDSKAPAFSLLGKQAVIEDYNKGAMILKPSAEILKPYLESKTLSQSAYDAILLNGISFISDKTNFTNSIFKMNQYSPMQSVVNALGPGEKYTYNDPTGKGGYTISKDPYGVSEYALEFSLKDIYMADGTKKTFNYPVPPAQIGNNLSGVLLDIQDKISVAAKASTENFRLFHQEKTQNK